LARRKAARSSAESGAAASVVGSMNLPEPQNF
jgi:hypothetical protein